MSSAEQYARAVLDGKIVAGKLVKLACSRFLADLTRDDIYFDEKEANKCVNFGERHCCLWEDKWQGKPVRFELWQKFILQQIYGWFRKRDGLRRFSKCYVQVAKKNAKSTLAGVVANFHLFSDDRVKTPKVFVGANNEDQAKICVNIAGKIVEYSPALSEFVGDGVVHLRKYGENIINIIHDERDGFIKAISKETANKTDKAAGGKHGKNPSLGIIDEYAMADTDATLSALQTGQGARDEPLIFAITTAGYKKDGPCYIKLRRVGIDVLEGKSIDDAYLVIIYEPDDDDSIYDEKTWIKSNPNLGVSVSVEFLRRQLSDAKLYGGETEVDIKTLNFDTWCDAAEVWISTEVWNKNTHGVVASELAGGVCFGGLDLASGLDINAFSLYFPKFKGDLNGLLTWYWMPAAKLEKNKEGKDYRPWVEAGLIKTTPGNAIDHEVVTNDISEICKQYQMHSIAYDPHLAHHGTVQNLAKLGITCNPFGQGFGSISVPTKEWEKLLVLGQIEHFGNPVTAWMNGNTSVTRDANRNMKIMKIDGDKGNLKIDGIASAINALAQSMSVEIYIDTIESW